MRIRSMARWALAVRNELATVGGLPRPLLSPHGADVGHAFGHDCHDLASADDRLPSANRVPGEQARDAPATLSICLHHHRNGPRFTMVGYQTVSTQGSTWLVGG